MRHAALYKRGGMSDWAQYIELFGQPVRVIKYDSYDEQTKAELKKILDESGSSLSIMIPRQTDFEIKDGKQTNCDGNLQLSFIKAMNEELSITVLGNTETTTSSLRHQAMLRARCTWSSNTRSHAVTLYIQPPCSTARSSSAILRSYGYPAGSRLLRVH